MSSVHIRYPTQPVPCGCGDHLSTQLADCVIDGMDVRQVFSVMFTHHGDGFVQRVRESHSFRDGKWVGD